MKALKKTTLSLAIAGVVYGAALTPVYGADINITHTASGNVANVDTGTTSDDGDTFNVASGVTLTSDTGFTEPALKIDANKVTVTAEILDRHITINGNVNGTLPLNSGSSDAPSDADGLLITGTTTSANTDSFKGNVTINGNVTGGANNIGLNSELVIDGNVTISKSGTVSGGGAVYLTKVTGDVVNAGNIIGNAANGVAMQVGSAGLISTPAAKSISNTGNITANGATGTALYITNTITDGISNSGTITGTTAISTIGGTTTFTNESSGIVGGDIKGGDSWLPGVINLVNKGLISSNFITAGTLDNQSGTIGVKDSIKTDGAVKNAGMITGTAVITVSGADVTSPAVAKALTNSGKIIAKSIDVNTGGLSNTSSGSITLTEALDVTTESSNEGAITAKYLLAGGGVNNGGSLILTGAVGGAVATNSVITGKLTNTGNISVADKLTANSGFDNGDSDHTSASTKVNGLLTVTGGALNNWGTLESGGLIFTAAQDFVNKGTAKVGKMTSGKDVTNTGSLAINEGSGAVNYNGSNGTLDLQLTSTLDSTPASLLATSTSATFNKNSKLVISASAASLAKTGSQTVTLVDGTSLLYADDAGGNGAAWGSQKLNITSSSILLDIDTTTVAYTGNDIIGTLEVKEAGAVAKSLGASASTQKLAGKLQAGVTAKVQTALDNAYGSFASNTTSEAQLKTYLENTRPDDSNVGAQSGANMTQAVRNNLYHRSVSKRTGINSGDMQANGGFWVQGLYGKSDQKSRGGSAAYKGDLRGMTLGLDRELGGSTTGVAFSYGKADASFARDQEDTVKSYMVSVYNIWERGNLYVDSSLSMGQSKHESQRLNGSATAKYGSNQLGAQALVGYYINQGDVMIEPMAGARLTVVNVDSSSHNLADGTSVYAADAVSYRQMEVGFGAAVSKAFAMGNNRTITPRAAVMYYHDFVGDELDTQVNFAGETYAIKGASAVKGSWEMNLGVDIMAGENFTVSAGYTHVRKTDFSSNNLNAKLKYMF